MTLLELLQPDIPNDTALCTVNHARRTPVLRIALITFLAVLVHGYHLGTDDSEIYIPAIKQVVDPKLYPFGKNFFESHAHLSLFPDLIGDSARLVHLPVNWVILIWHVACVFLLLLASWRLAGVCFETGYARWGAVALIAGVLTVPVAGTALIIMDPYLTARSLSTPAVLFAVASYMSKRPQKALAWLLLTVLIHPQMSVYCAAFLGCLELATRVKRASLQARGLIMPSLFGLTFLFDFEPARGAAREALYSRSYFFVNTWTWYEWIGVFAPLVLLWLFSLGRLRGTTPAFRCLTRTLVPFGLLFTIAGLVLAFSQRLENLARLQPMRAFHLLYIIFFLCLGGLIGEYALRSGIWRWIGLFAPLGAFMWFVQWHAYPYSEHVELPGTDRNAWKAAFLWVRNNTPKDAVFALDPNYMLAPGDDLHGFRAIAERSALAENVKDSGVVALFPQLADEWKKQVKVQTGFDKFRLSGFEKLSQEYPVSWIVTRHRPADMICPYQNSAVAVCKIPKENQMMAGTLQSSVHKVSRRPMPMPVPAPSSPR